jgi:hypothetical protein
MRILSCRFEKTGNQRPSSAADGAATRTALERYAEALELRLVKWSR